VTTHYDRYYGAHRHSRWMEVLDLVRAGVRPSAEHIRDIARRYEVSIASVRYDVKRARRHDKPRDAPWSGQSTPKVRAAVYARDRWTCQYCGEQGDTIEHVVPRSMNGPGRTFNLVVSCANCNMAKGAAVWLPACIDVLAQESPLWARFIGALAADAG
jgi:5-methylcytosine-specific restriction endonuclease McrA